jgi:type II secretory ATPase GspE/PulE/Tfp pilus assembly ATPase PilB-like protein
MANIFDLDRLLPFGDLQAKERLLHDLVTRYGVVPMMTQFDQPSVDTLHLFLFWVDKLGYDWKKDDAWLPVGMVGPILVLGISGRMCMEGGELPECPLPLWSCSRVVVPEDYARSCRDSLIELLGSGMSLDVASFHLPVNLGFSKTAVPINSLYDVAKIMLSNLCLNLKTSKFLNLFLADNLQGKPMPSVELFPEGVYEALVYAQKMFSCLQGGGSYPMLLDVRDVVSQPEALALVPDDLGKEHRACAYFTLGALVYLAVPNFQSFGFEDAMLAILGSNKKLVLVVTPEKAVLSVQSGQKVTLTVPLEKRGAEVSVSANFDAVVDTAVLVGLDVTSVTTPAPLVFNWVLAEALAQRASDIHMEVVHGKGRIRLRVDGVCREVLSLPVELFNRVRGVCKNLSNMSSNDFDIQDARFSAIVDKLPLDVRVNAMPFRDSGQKMTLRLLDKGKGFKRISDLELGETHLSSFKQVLSRNQGLMLVTGPTGSGKSTTLYAALAYLNSIGVNIQTVEDPIEYEIEGINQTRIMANRGVTYEGVVKGLLRADPDVVFIGEIRDPGTAKLAVEMAQTGHLVLSTLHTLNAVNVVERLRQVGVEPGPLGEAVICLQAQRLLRRLCPRCRKVVPVTDRHKHHLTRHLKKELESGRVKMPDRFYVHKGCADCAGVGYYGQFAAMEVLVVDEEFQDMIISNAPLSALRDCFAKKALSLYKEALLRVIKGDTDFEEILGLGSVQDICDIVIDSK